MSDIAVAFSSPLDTGSLNDGIGMEYSIEALNFSSLSGLVRKSSAPASRQASLQMASVSSIL